LLPHDDHVAFAWLRIGAHCRCDLEISFSRRHAFEILKRLFHVTQIQQIAGMIRFLNSLHRQIDTCSAEAKPLHRIGRRIGAAQCPLKSGRFLAFKHDVTDGEAGSFTGRQRVRAFCRRGLQPYIRSGFKLFTQSPLALLLTKQLLRGRNRFGADTQKLATKKSTHKERCTATRASPTASERTNG
jgi:hypothetical protein